MTRALGDFARLAPLARPHRAAFALAMAATVAESAAALSLPWMAGLFAEGVLAGEGPVAVGTVLAAMLGLFAAIAAARFAAAYLVDGLVDRIVAALRVGLYDRLQALPLAWHQSRALGDSLALLTHDTYVLSGFLTGVLVAALPLALTAAGAVAMMSRIAPELALAAVLLVPVVHGLLRLAGRRLRPLAAALREEEARVLSLAQENLGLAAAVKSYTREPRESARFAGRIARILDLSARQRRLHAGLGPLVQFLAAAALLAMLALASLKLGEGTLGPAGLVAFLLYAWLLSSPVAGIADLYGQAQAARAALARVQQVFDAPIEGARPGDVRLEPVPGPIEFRGVRFAYEGREAALSDFELVIQPGECVALAGPNGAGKSTVGHLLMRLHEPAAGEIRIAGVDIARAEVASLRAAIGWVPQHVMLFNASIRDNIAYGRDGCDARAVELAARAARAHEFIASLPDGYETVIGDRGMRLSGGQQQRIALARALLKDPPILVLDEAFAMLDPQAERALVRALVEGPRRRTVLLIAHGEAILEAADRVVHMEAGRARRIEVRRPAVRPLAVAKG